MRTIILIAGGLCIAAALYAWFLSRIRPLYEPENTHWAAFWGFGLIVAAFLAVCLTGTLPIAAFWILFGLCWAAFLPILIWREAAKHHLRRKRSQANQRKH